MRRASLVLSVLVFTACMVTADDLKPVKVVSTPAEVSREVLEYQAWARQCRGTLEKREACLQPREKERQKRTSR